MIISTGIVFGLETMLKERKLLSEAQILADEIDQLVYQLYNLTEAEIKITEAEAS
ncbi:hypothetical protein [Subsaximicrobium wynnwilliamsii]|uniref:hypothetical protein n=1 Tax=Subsaximicrobium wynnwilliamsii TaxID=291179 RepID=UPI001676C645|nr:hypothetical protein [Subsaximicrobium wynnwilliamsii]